MSWPMTCSATEREHEKGLELNMGMPDWAAAGISTVCELRLPIARSYRGRHKKDK
jgi:hypothetical protein